MHKSSQQRHAGIDFLRGLSIIFVIIHHTHFRLPLDQGWLKNLLSPSSIKVICWSGYYGVIAFFVISGFLITTTSLRRWGELSQMDYKQFIRLRFARIFPCLAGLLIISTLFHLAGVSGFVIKNTTLANAVFAALSFHMNWLESTKGYLPGNWDILWSLSVEEMFYLFFPLICLSFRNKKIICFIMLSLILFGPISRSMHASDLWWNEYSYFSCVDAIAIGCLAALFENKRLLKQSKTVLFLLIGLVLSLFILVFREEAYALGLASSGLGVSVFALGIGFILIALQKMENLPIFHSQYVHWVALLGKNSYEIYLTHMFVVLLVSSFFIKAGFSCNLIPFCYLGILVVSLALGHLIAQFYSEPLNRYIRKGKLDDITLTQPNLIHLVKS